MSRTSILVSSRNDGLLPNGNQLQRSLAFLNHKLECQCASRFDFQKRIAKFKTAQSFSICDSKRKISSIRDSCTDFHMTLFKVGIEIPNPIALALL